MRVSQCLDSSFSQSAKKNFFSAAFYKDTNWITKCGWSDETSRHTRTPGKMMKEEKLNIN